MKLVDVIEKLNIQKRVTILQLKSIFNVVKNEDKIDIVSLIENLFNSFSIDIVQSINSYEIYTDENKYENVITDVRVENGNCVYKDPNEKTITLIIAAATTDRKLLILEN